MKSSIIEHILHIIPKKKKKDTISINGKGDRKDEF